MFQHDPIPLGELNTGVAFEFPGETPAPDDDGDFPDELDSLYVLVNPADHRHLTTFDVMAVCLGTGELRYEFKDKEVIPSRFLGYKPFRRDVER